MLLPKKKIVRNPRLLKQFHEFCMQHNIGCLYCDSPEIQVHHGIYRSQGGSDLPSNLYPLCQEHHDKVHHNGKPSYYEIKKLKEQKWLQLEQKLNVDLSDHLS